MVTIRDTVLQQADIFETLLQATNSAPRELVDFANSIGEQLEINEHNDCIINGNLLNIINTLEKIVSGINQTIALCEKMEQTYDEHLNGFVTVHGIEEYIQKSVNNRLEMETTA